MWRTCFDVGSPAGEDEDEDEGEREREREDEDDYEGEREGDYEGEREGGRIGWCDYGERFSFAHTRRCLEWAPAFRLWRTSRAGSLIRTSQPWSTPRLRNRGWLTPMRGTG